MEKLQASDDSKGCSGGEEHRSFLHAHSLQQCCPALPWDAAGSQKETQPAAEPYFKWKENNSKNKSKDHSDWKSIAIFKHNNYNHIYWPSCRVRAHRQDHQLRWIAIAPLTSPLHHSTTPPLISPHCVPKMAMEYNFSPFIVQSPNHFKKYSCYTAYFSLILHLTVIHSPALSLSEHMHQCSPLASCLCNSWTKGTSRKILELSPDLLKSLVTFWTRRSQSSAALSSCLSHVMSRCGKVRICNTGKVMMTGLSVPDFCFYRLTLNCSTFFFFLIQLLTRTHKKHIKGNNKSTKIFLLIQTSLHFTGLCRSRSVWIYLNTSTNISRPTVPCMSLLAPKNSPVCYLVRGIKMMIWRSVSLAEGGEKPNPLLKTTIKGNSPLCPLGSKAIMSERVAPWLLLQAEVVAFSMIITNVSTGRREVGGFAKQQILGFPASVPNNSCWTKLHTKDGAALGIALPAPPELLSTSKVGVGYSVSDVISWTFWLKARES